MTTPHAVPDDLEKRIEELARFCVNSIVPNTEAEWDDYNTTIISALRSLVPIVRDSAMIECEEIARKQAKKFHGPGGQSMTQMEANRRSAEACRDIAQAISQRRKANQ